MDVAMRRTIAVLIAACAFSVLASAQTSTLPCSGSCTLARNQPFSVAYNWAPTTLNPDAADGFRLYQNSVKVQDVPATALVNGVIAFPFASGLTIAGSYVFAVSAYTSGGESVGDPITVTIVKGKPAKPTSGRIQ